MSAYKATAGAIDNVRITWDDFWALWLPLLTGRLSKIINEKYRRLGAGTAGGDIDTIQDGIDNRARVQAASTEQQAFVDGFLQRNREAQINAGTARPRHADHARQRGIVGTPTLTASESNRWTEYGERVERRFLQSLRLDPPADMETRREMELVLRDNMTRYEGNIAIRLAKLRAETARHEARSREAEVKLARANAVQRSE